MIALYCSVLSFLRAHCSNIAKLLAYAIFDGACFWVRNAKKKKKKHLLAYAILNGNALISNFFFFIFFLFEKLLN